MAPMTPNPALQRNAPPASTLGLSFNLECIWTLILSTLPLISKGRHERFIINKEKFDARVEAKAGA